MKNEVIIMYELNKEKIEQELESYCELTEQSFYPPLDDRVYTSGIDDIEGGDNFAEYAEYFWETYEEDIYDGESF